MLLPPTGGRLVLVSDSVASQAGPALHGAVHSAPLKTAAQDAVRLAARQKDARAPDASAVVVDVLPLGDTFAELCRRQEAPAAAARGGSRRGLLRWGSRAVSAEAQAAAAQAAEAQLCPLPAARLLISFDSAQLLGLVPRSISPRSGSSFGRPKALDRISSNGLARLSKQLISAAIGAGVGATPAAEQSLGPPDMLAPAWFDESEAQLLRALLVSAAAD